MGALSFEAAREIARRAAEHASKRLGEPLWLRDYPAEVDGDVGSVVIGVARGGVHRAIARVSDLRSRWVAIVEHDARLIGHAMTGDGAIDKLGDAIADASARERPLGMIDAACAILDGLRTRLGVAGSRWRDVAWGEWDPSRGCGMAVELAGEHAWPELIAIVGRKEGGVVLTLPASVIGGEPRSRMLATPGDLVEVLIAVTDDVRAAVDGRAAFRARPDGLPAVIQQLAKQLGEVGVRSVRATWSDARYPTGWPTGVIHHRDDHGDHACAMLGESSDGIVATIGRTTLAGDAITAGAVAAAMRAEDARLSVRTLRLGAAYEVIAPFRDLVAGDRVKLLDIAHHPRDGGSAFRFDRVQLWDVDPGDADVLARLDEFLRPS